MIQDMGLAFYWKIKEIKCQSGFLKGFRDFQKLQKGWVLTGVMGFIMVWLLGSTADFA